MSDLKKNKISFFLKNKSVCPVCMEQFNREEIRMGRGRFVTDALTIELRRTYKETQKYGQISPLTYSMTVCPSCYYSAFSVDFDTISRGVSTLLLSSSQSRIDEVKSVFGPVNYREYRDLKAGFVSYYLGLLCYENWQSQISPLTRQAVCSIRAAWLASDLHKNEPNQDWDYVARIFYHKARYFYNIALERENSGVERIEIFSALGPDTDKNYGFDGILYLSSYLEFKYGQKKDKERRIHTLERFKNIMARVFGIGKTSSSKPIVILERTRVLFDNIKAEIDRLSNA